MNKTEIQPKPTMLGWNSSKSSSEGQPAKCQSCTRDAVCYGLGAGDALEPSCEGCCEHEQCFAVGVVHALESGAA